VHRSDSTLCPGCTQVSGERTDMSLVKVEEADLKDWVGYR
jgi:hypothetical protein